ncbi:MAG TPA: hypothetical protein VEA78_12220, partial [Acidimicrobiales bacterium]|nr:hypothetical protein [Acidimicrobiales bacterium]
MRYLAAAPWRRAPRLLLRRPGVLATVAGATIVLVAAVASVPLFLSSVRTEAVALQVDERCPTDTGVTIERPATTVEVTAAPHDPFAPLHPRIADTTQWFRLESVWLEHPTVETNRAQTYVLARDDALDHVEILEGDPNDDDTEGIWISDRVAESTGIRTGDTATLGAAPMPVAGIYRDLSGATVDDTWCSHADMLLLRGQDLESPPPVVIASRA